MALPFLPHELIPTVFELLELEATTDPLQQFVRYIRSTWIESTVWPPANWSVFMMSVRTNNDVEGWPKIVFPVVTKAYRTQQALINQLIKKPQLTYVVLTVVTALTTVQDMGHTQ